MFRRCTLRLGFFRGLYREGAFGNRGQGRRLGDVEVAHRLAEVALGRGLDAVASISEIDLVEVQLEDLVLRVVLLDLPRDLRLAKLPAQGLVPSADVLGHRFARELHRDGRESLRHAHLEHVVLDRAEDPDPVDPVVLVEPLVFGADERRPHERRHLTERHHGAPLQAEIGDQPAVGGVDLRGLVGVVSAQLVDGGTAVAGTGPGPGRDHHCDGERKHREDRNEDVAPRAGSEPGARGPLGSAGDAGGPCR